MLRNVKHLRGCAIHATDGEIGEVDDLYFDDEDWEIRYLVVATGGWLANRRVLIAPAALGHPDWPGKALPVALTRAQVEGSPDIDTRKPVSRQHEAAYLAYYGYPYYWGGAGLWGMGAYGGGLTTEGGFEQEMKTRRDAETQPPEDVHLRSCDGMIGHHVHATDGDIGHVRDLLVDDRHWSIRYLIVDTGTWWGGHQVLIAPRWIRQVSWREAKVLVDLTRQAVQDAPAFDSIAGLERQQEEAMHQHYGRPGYWSTHGKRGDDAPRAR